jgi:hypothetical protein
LFAFIAGCSMREMPATCETNCTHPYGAVLGTSSQGVTAYSNCQNMCVSYQPNTYNDVFTGVKWQCVEYARRWLLVNKGVVFSDVETAADMWNKIDHVTNVTTKQKFPLESRLNGSNHPPQTGDLLIYAGAFYDTGHVAVITNVDHDNGIIELGEQNYNNELWPDNFSRTITFINKDGYFWLLDGYLLGWKQIID